MSASLVGSEMCIRDRPKGLMSSVAPDGRPDGGRALLLVGSPWHLLARLGTAAASLRVTESRHCELSFCLHFGQHVFRTLDLGLCQQGACIASG
eukprot:2016943-Alexandrium_andersonii.AAC.1